MDASAYPFSAEPNCGDPRLIQVGRFVLNDRLEAWHNKQCRCGSICSPRLRLWKCNSHAIREREGKRTNDSTGLCEKVHSQYSGTTSMTRVCDSERLRRHCFQSQRIDRQPGTKEITRGVSVVDT